MIRLACIGGTGDVYLVCALAPEVAARSHGAPVTVAVPAKYAAIPQMFDQRFEIADEEIRTAEGDEHLKREYDNYIAPGRTFYAHPCFTRNQRLDELTVLPRSPSQADMYRALLGLPADAPLALPRLPVATPIRGDAILLTDAVSWPNTKPRFWHALERDMRAAGWNVRVNSPSWPLVELLARCAFAELVVGPQCGVMSILVAGRFLCRIVMATPAIDAGPWFTVGKRTLHDTLPYAYVTKFDGQDYDVEEHFLTDTNHGAVIRSILAAPRAPRDPRPVESITMPLTPGDFLDRLAVLTVKMDRFPPERRALVEREYRRYALAAPPGFVDSVEFRRLLDVHYTAFDFLERTAPDPDTDHGVAFRLNRTRTIIKNEVDVARRAPYTEVKSYYR